MNAWQTLNAGLGVCLSVINPYWSSTGAPKTDGPTSSRASPPGERHCGVHLAPPAPGEDTTDRLNRLEL